MSAVATLRNILVAVAGGLLLGLAGFALVARFNRQPIQWRKVGISLGVALAATLAGVLLAVLTFPDGGPTLPGWVLAAVSIPLLPGSAAMGLLGPLAIAPVPFFGGFVLNIVLWSVLAYFVLARLRRAQA